MEKRSLVLGALAVAAAATLAGSRRILRQWAENPDPLEGRPVRFPVGDRRVVTLADGAQIATTTVGSGPAIVCVHGLTASHHDWGPIAPALLEQGFQLIAVDQRGHGESSEGSAGFGSAQLGRDLRDVLSSLDVHAIALMGHSMGGMAAMAYAVDSPDEFDRRVSSLILVGTAASLVVPGSRVGFRLTGIQIPAWLKPSNRRLRLGAGLSVFGRRPSLHMVDEAIASATQLPEDVRALATSALGTHNVLDRLDGVTKDALVIGGTRDLLIRTSQVRDLARALPRAELHLLDGAGHMLIWERHEEIATLVTSFLSSIASRR